LSVLFPYTLFSDSHTCKKTNQCNDSDDNQNCDHDADR